MTTAKKLFVKTYGCQMNVYDSERMIDAMAADGYEQTDTPDNADMILMNTCHIREKAAEKIYSELGRLKPLKAKKPDLKFAVAGCVAQAEGQEIIARQPIVDMVVGPQAYHRLPDMVAKSSATNKLVDTEFPAEDKFEHLPRGPKMKRATSAFLTVQEGCDKFCAFCVVPYTRGAEVSRPVERLLDEAREMIGRGVRDITLLGQNVNAYHGAGPGGDWTLAQLIRELAKIDDLKRIRFTTSHPNDMTDDLINAFGDTEKLMPYLHLPVQAGSNTVLKAMNRKHTAESYYEIIDRIREVRPDLALSGDFIVGFPGEDEADFQATLDLCERVRYAQAYSFKYSERPGTPAAESKKLVPEDVKSERLARLQEMLTAHQWDFQTSLVGQELDVLFEKTGRMDGQLIGRSEYLIPVHVFAPDEMIGEIKRVKVEKSERNSLTARLV